DFIGPSIDQQRQNVAARDDRIDMDRLPVQAALPSAAGFFQFEPVGLAALFAADDDFINHKLSAALPSVPAVSNWMAPKLARWCSHSCRPVTPGRARRTFRRQLRQLPPRI